MSAKKTEVEVEGQKIAVSNLDKVLYPATGFTKAQTIDYYIRIAPALLPHLQNRPLTLKRYPEGVQGLHFYEKECPGHRPDWIKTALTPGSGRHKAIHYCIVENLAGLVWLANLADLELHPFLHCQSDLATPTALVFDLDPGPPADILDCCRVALRLRNLLGGLKLETLVKTSGSKGLQVYIPLNTPVTYDETSYFAQSTAFVLAREYPEEIVAKMAKQLRGGKVFIDWSQNDDHKTTVCVYSLRAMERPTVSAPVTWDEVETALRRKQPLGFTSDEVLGRVERDGDLFAPMLKLKQRLPLY